MHRYFRRSLALLLVAFAVFSGLGCSVGNTSKISNDKVNALNAAGVTFNAKVVALDSKARKDARGCTDKATKATCVKKIVAKHDAAMRSAALVWAAAYDDVVAKTDGSCQTAVKDVARTIRADAKKISGGSFPSAASLNKSQSVMAKACNLKVENKK